MQQMHPEEKSPHREDENLPLPRSTEEMRRRDTGWKVTAPLNIALIFGLLSLVGGLSLVLPKPTVSEFENRKLQEKPKFSWDGLIHGDYNTDLELYYADTFPMREFFVHTAGVIKENFGLRSDDVRIHTSASQSSNTLGSVSTPEKTDTPPNTDPPQTETSTESAPSQAPDASQTPSSSEAPVQQEDPPGEQEGSVFVYKGAALPIFYASDSMSSYYAQTLNLWQETLGEEFTLYNLIVPTHIEFALPPKYQDISSPQKPNIDSIYSQLSPSIKRVDAYSKLEAHKDEYLYFNTDHHWTGLGAYYAYQAFCEQAGWTPVPLESMEKRTLENFVGSLYAQTQDSVLLENPDHVDYWIIPTPHQVLQYRRGSPYYGYPSTLLGEYAQSPNSYSVFLQGDYPLTKIATNLNTGRKIAVIKESFGNAFSPFLVNHYDEVHVIDQRYFQLNLPAYLRENGIHEVLFINNIFAANTGVRIDEIRRLIYQVYTPPTAEPEEEEEEPESSSEEEKPKKPKREEYDPWADEFEKPYSRVEIDPWADD